MRLVKGRPLDETGRLEKEIRSYDLLDFLGIEYERVDHEAAFTMDACVEINEALAPAMICKNLLLSNRKRSVFYLLMVANDKKFDSKEVSKQVNSSRLSFAPEEYLQEFLDITPGSASVLGLMNDKENRVQLLVDEDIFQEEYFGCHPCINTSSLRIKTEDIFGRFLKAVGHDYIKVHLS